MNRRLLVLVTLAMALLTCCMVVVSVRYNKAVDDVEGEASRIVMRERLKNDGEQ